MKIKKINIKRLEQFLNRRNLSEEHKAIVLRYVRRVQDNERNLASYLVGHLLVAITLILIPSGHAEFLISIACVVVALSAVVTAIISAIVGQQLEAARSKSAIIPNQLEAFDAAYKDFLDYYDEDLHDRPFSVREEFLAEVEDTLPELLSAAKVSDWREVSEVHLRHLRRMHFAALAFVDMEPFEYLLDIADKD